MYLFEIFYTNSSFIIGSIGVGFCLVVELLMKIQRKKVEKTIMAGKMIRVMVEELVVMSLRSKVKIYLIRSDIKIP